MTFRTIGFTLAAPALLLVAFGQTPRSTRAHHAPSASIPAAFKAAAKPLVADGCDATLWEHVYHPQRLKVVEKCIAVTGTIHHSKPEADGDEHVQLTLDSEFSNLLNDRNNKVQAKSLVIEPVCQGPVTQADAVAACRDFHSDIDLFPKGKHVRVLGSYVLDSEANHSWMEVHPVTSITAVE